MFWLELFTILRIIFRIIEYIYKLINVNPSDTKFCSCIAGSDNGLVTAKDG